VARWRGEVVTAFAVVEDGVVEDGKEEMEKVGELSPKRKMSDENHEGSGGVGGVSPTKKLRRDFYQQWLEEWRGGMDGGGEDKGG